MKHQTDITKLKIHTCQNCGRRLFDKSREFCKDCENKKSLESLLLTK